MARAKQLTTLFGKPLTDAPNILDMPESELTPNQLADLEAHRRASAALNISIREKVAAYRSMGTPRVISLFAEA